MKNLFIILGVAFAFALTAPLMAQGRGGQGPSKQDIEKWRKGNRGGGDQGGDWLKKRINELGWGENGDEERVEPGDTVDNKDKDKRLEEEAEKLGLEDDKVIRDLVKYAKRAWLKAEREDSKLARAHKRYKNDEEKWEEAVKDHKEELADIWEDCDETLEKKEIIAGKVLEEFKENTKDIRETTATMKSAEQDKIRERKIEELRKQAADWAKNNGMGGSKEDNDVKKEKKEDEE